MGNDVSNGDGSQPGVTFEMSEPHFVFQRDGFVSGDVLEAPGGADMVFPDQAFDGEALATVDDVVGALERDPGLMATVVGTREAGAYEATEVTIANSIEPGPNRPPTTLGRSEQHDAGWIAPPDGTLWIMETPDGIAVVTAEWFEPSGMEPTHAVATEVLDSIVIGG